MLRGEKAIRRFNEIKVTEDLIEDVSRYSLTAERALEKLPKHKGRVHRGETHSPMAPRMERVKKAEPGDLWPEDQFLSTSTAKASSFSGNLRLVITSREGRKIAKVSRHQTEKEVLFKPGHKFMVLRTDHDGGTLHLHLLDVEGLTVREIETLRKTIKQD